MLRAILNYLRKKPKTTISVKCAHCRLFQDITESKDMKLIDKKLFKKCPLELKWVSFDTEACDLLDSYRNDFQQIINKKAP